MKLTYLGLLFLAGLGSCTSSLPQASCEFPEEQNRYSEAHTYGYRAFSDIEAAQKCAELNRKPVLILFTGWATSPSPDIPWTLLQNEEIKKTIEHQFVFATLYIDDKSPLPASQLEKDLLGENSMKTMGERNQLFQKALCNNRVQPWFTITDHRLRPATEGIGYLPTGEEQKFLDFLNKGLNDNR